MCENSLRDEVFNAMRMLGYRSLPGRVVIRQMSLPHVFRVDLDGAYFGTWDSFRKTFAD